LNRASIARALVLGFAAALVVAAVLAEPQLVVAGSGRSVFFPEGYRASIVMGPVADHDRQADEEDGVTESEEFSDDEDHARRGGPKNHVRVVNRTDGRLRVRGHLQLNRIRGSIVEPENLALAYSSCVRCQSIGVALQINLIGRTSDWIAPQNAAVAMNVECKGCYTVARAIQYVYSVDDPTTQIPDEASLLIHEMNRELRDIHSDRRITLAEAEARIDAVIAQFRQLPLILNLERADQLDPDDGDAAPAATATPTPVPTGTSAPSVVPEPTATPAGTP
jgi:hypothetical protein